MSYTLARLIIGFVFRVLWRPRVVGRGNIPRDGPVILASNHLSFIDSVVIPLMVPRRVRFLAKAEYFDGGGLRAGATAFFFRMVDAVPVRRENQRDAVASLDLALQVLRDGFAFGIYPEGTRSRDGRLYRGRTGVGWLAMASGAPIVPVTLTGTDRIQPIGTRLPRIHRVRVVFGEPIDPASYIARVAAEGGAGKARREITDLVMDRIAASSGQERVAVYNQRPSDDGLTI
ncbi:MAG TPA: lysophospholipid acyltransferase family protein [Kineosporiaceae bacterium]|nr:lysophospholipid acyltransferase family protein [Kineosporiaceae bacterium]